MDDNASEQLAEIKVFLEGSDDQQYITAIEGDYFNNEVTLILDDPQRGKLRQTANFQPFCFIKNLKNLKVPLYSGSKRLITAAMEKHGIKIEELKTDSHERLELGYKYLVTTTKKLYNINSFFKEGGLKTFGDESNSTLAYKGTEQFLMTTGKRLFKGFENYRDVHKLYFDIETTSLRAEDGNIFLIGLKDTRGFKKVLTIDLNDPIESEKRMIIDFFQIIIDLKPSIIAGYNSEAFDFYYILERANILGIDLGSKDEDGNLVYDVQTTFDPQTRIARKAATLKLGGESENYEQTIIWGTNVIDISHAVRAAKAINSEIKGWGLKYITQFIKANKENRMYVMGDRIYKTWFENKWYFINKSNNEYQVLPESFQESPEAYIPKLKNWINKVNNTEDKESLNNSLIKVHEFFGGDVDNVGIISGKDIVHQYLLDDLDETEQVDERYGQSNFMLGKIMPTGYVRSSTMGNASKWKMLLATYSYGKRIAIPINEKKRDIVGGLSRLLQCGYAKNVLKADFSALYPSIQLTHKVFPSSDITQIIKWMLLYFKETRSEYKGYGAIHEKNYELTKDPKELALFNFWDTKQLPVKILGNSGFGAISAPHIFNWGDNNVGEEITCTGRQYLRSMVHFFHTKGFRALVGDTDGINFAMPANYESLIYTDKKGKVHTSYDAVFAEYNDLFMYGAMKLSVDGLYAATINLARKNYIDLFPDGKIKLVGNSLKGSSLPTYLADMINQSAKFLAYGDGKSFIQNYNNTLTLIYNKQIPLMKIASKSKVKEKVSEYIRDQANNVNKNGKAMPKKAHMELLIKEGLTPDLGTNVYYVNNGTAKSHSDIEHAYLIHENDYISDPDKLGDYNIKRAIDAFNKKMEMFLVCFKQNVRETLLITNPKDIQFYTDEDMELISGKGLKAESQDCLTIEDYTPEYKNEPLFEMSEKEVMFWNRSGKDPKVIFPHFTTELSRVPLITQEEQVIKKAQQVKIQDFFRSHGAIVKTDLDYIRDGENFIKYHNIFTKEEMVFNEKTGKNVKMLVDTILPEMSWILAVNGKDRFEDLEIIDKSIYE